MYFLTKKNQPPYQGGLTFISHLFHQKQQEQISTNKIIQLNEELIIQQKKQVTSPREKAQSRDKEKANIRQITIRSYSSLQVNDLVENALKKEKFHIRLKSPNKFCRVKALQEIRERQKSPTFLIKQRTQPIYSQSIPSTARVNGY
ncbi:unnamed protein product (macronuclear) [Paramecium tetraurelia]|uniref:Uncharacterized protein n=1 Tax=Paramecium tetraurelia TaxID=5888 RepID=A0C743_PARTE|nr:uncharacterized protein GSPATT00035740001 [Paramecium tetraurelia]CAK66610.1 unnamed protein product [Paramecium tetraurelia]|eukprot:XP_001434007.1 hypothetical protein (macronuclear) [Paramecium tetraurelia strain d4-2]